MKTYEVLRTFSGEIGVLIHDEGTDAARILEHCVLHSPTGMETGFGGSGPADLAASILADHLQVGRRVLEDAWQGNASDAKASRVIHLYQTFKFDFIAPRKLEPGKSYEIEAIDIERWILCHE